VGLLKFTTRTLFIMPPTLAILRVKNGLRNAFCASCGEAIEAGSPDRAALHIIAGSRCHLVCRSCGVKLDPVLAAVASKTHPRTPDWWTENAPETSFFITEIVRGDSTLYVPEIVPPEPTIVPEEVRSGPLTVSGKK